MFRNPISNSATGHRPLQHKALRILPKGIEVKVKTSIDNIHGHRNHQGVNRCHPQGDNQGTSNAGGLTTTTPKERPQLRSVDLTTLSSRSITPEPGANRRQKDDVFVFWCHLNNQRTTVLGKPIHKRTTVLVSHLAKGRRFWCPPWPEDDGFGKTTRTRTTVLVPPLAKGRRFWENHRQKDDGFVETITLDMPRGRRFH